MMEAERTAKKRDKGSAEGREQERKEEKSEEDREELIDSQVYHAPAKPNQITTHAALPTSNPASPPSEALTIPWISEA